jgi:hypothetical protein
MFIKKMAVFWVVASLVLQKFTDVSEVLAVSIIAVMIDVARTSETSVNIYKITLQYSPADGHLHTHRREDLKSNNVY